MDFAIDFGIDPCTTWSTKRWSWGVDIRIGLDANFIAWYHMYPYYQKACKCVFFNNLLFRRPFLQKISCKNELRT